MKTALISILTLSIVIALAPGCEDHAHDHGASTGPTDHHGHAHDHGGAKETLGRVDAGGFEIVAVQNGKFAPGEEVNFDVEVMGPARPTSVRFWLGSEDVGNAMKKSADEVKGDVYHVDLDVPANAPAQSRLWVEVQAASGAPVRASFDVKR